MSGVPQSEVEEMEREVEILQSLIEGAKYHISQYEDKRALTVAGEIERRKRDLEMQVSFWEERDE